MVRSDVRWKNVRAESHALSIIAPVIAVAEETVICSRHERLVVVIYVPPRGEIHASAASLGRCRPRRRLENPPECQAALWVRARGEPADKPRRACQTTA